MPPPVLYADGSELLAYDPEEQLADAGGVRKKRPAQPDSHHRSPAAHRLLLFHQADGVRLVAANAIDGRQALRWIGAVQVRATAGLGDYEETRQTVRPKQLTEQVKPP
jgi:hypothetical protein